MNDRPSFDIGIARTMSSMAPTADNPFRLGYGKDQQRVVEFFAPFAEDGVRLFIRHLPFGYPGDGPMPLDAAVELRLDDRFRHLLDDYDRATEWFADRFPDARIVDYLGTIESDLAGLLDAGAYGKLMLRLWASVERPLGFANTWIGLDASAGSRYADDGVFDEFAKMVAAMKRRQGNDIVVEALPTTRNDWAWDHHALVLHSFWTRALWFGVGDDGHDRFHPAHYLDDAEDGTKRLSMRFASDNELTLRWINGHSRRWLSDRDDGGRDFLANCVRFGHVPVFDDPEKQIGRTAGEVRELLMDVADDPDVGRFNADGHFEMVRPAEGLVSDYRR